MIVLWWISIVKKNSYSGVLNPNGDAGAGLTDRTNKTENKMKQEISVDLAVLGGGPGGYTAAFRAADLGLSVCLIERRSSLGGVCVNVGLYPFKDTAAWCSDS